MAVIKSGNSTDVLSVDPISKALRCTLYVPDGTLQTPAVRASYLANTGSIVPGTTPTDIFTITGSATKLVKVFRMYIGGTQNPGGVNGWFVVKRSTANSGGTSAVVSEIRSDQNDPAATATVLSYTGNPTLGAVVGNAWSGFVASPTPSIASLGTVIGVVIDFTEQFGKPIVLRSTSDVLAINFGGAALPAATSVRFGVRWTEEIVP